jgi:hypothetical protein
MVQEYLSNKKNSIMFYMGEVIEIPVGCKIPDGVKALI